MEVDCLSLNLHLGISCSYFLDSTKCPYKHPVNILSYHRLRNTTAEKEQNNATASKSYRTMLSFSSIVLNYLMN